MIWQLQFYAEVNNDVLSAKKWYKKQQSGLEKRFAEEVKQAFVRIQSNPLMYEANYRDIRIKHLDIFPFGIHYKLKSDSQLIIIIAILHHSQHPDTLIHR